MAKTSKALKALAAVVVAIDTSYQTSYESVLHGVALGMYIGANNDLYDTALDILADRDALTSKAVEASFAETAELALGSLPA